MTGRFLPIAVCLLLAAPAWADLAVPKRGPLLRGEIAVDVKAGNLTHDGKARPLTDFLVIEKDDGTLVWAPDFKSRAMGYERAVFLQRRPKLVSLTKEAVRARALDVSKRLFAWAQKEGLSGKDERILRKRIEALAKKRRKVNQKRLAPVLREEKQLRRQQVAFLLARAQREQGPDGLRLLRLVLDLEADNGAALRLLEERAPEKHPFENTRAWLEWTLDLKPRGFKLAPADLRALKRAKFNWRPDLYGVMTDRILIITPVTDFKVVGGLALRADAVVRELEKLFATPKPMIRSKEPLKIHLFSNRANFRERVGYRSVAAIAPYFSFTHGKWSLKDDTTRIWCQLPLKRWVPWTLVHEVVRHWMWSRCPRFSAKQVGEAPLTSGYGVAIGLVQMFADAPFDTRTAQFDLTSRDHRAFRILKYVPAKQRQPWRKFFLMDRQDLHLLNGRDPAVDGKAPKGTMYMAEVFQAQGAAVAHYLYNVRRGAKRRVLADYVTNQYLGERPKLAPATAFGMSADELGAAVLRYALK